MVIARGKKANKVKDGVVFDVVNGIFMCFMVFMFVVPLLFVVSTALESPAAYNKYGYSIFPRDIDFGAFIQILSDTKGFLGALKDTVIVTLLGAALNLFFTAAMGYGLSKKTLPFRTAITGMVFFTMLFGGGMIPTFMVVRMTGLLDSYWALIVPGLISAWNMFLMRNFFMAIPESLLESAALDGANEIRILFQIVIPLSSAAMATMALFYGVGHWNDWMGVLLYMPGRKISSLQYYLRTILDGSDLDRLESISDYINIPTQQTKMAALVVATVPMLVVYPFLQRYFVKGIIVGSVKG